MVTRCGPACGELKPGGRVLLVRPGSMRSHPLGPVDAVMPIPDDMTIEDAVSSTNPAMTAYHALINLARLREGEKVLIHSAAGSMGQIAIWIAKMWGAEIFATVSSEHKKQFLVTEFGIPPDHVLYSRNTSFAKGIMRLTGGAGVDVIINSLSGRSLHATWECIAPYGRFIEIGKSDILSNTALPMGPFRGNVSFFAVDVQHISRFNLRLTHELLVAVMDLLARKVLRNPLPTHIFSVSNIEAAFRQVQSGKHTGRVVITAGALDTVPVSGNYPRHGMKVEGLQIPNRNFFVTPVPGISGRTHHISSLEAWEGLIGPSPAGWHVREQRILSSCPGRAHIQA